MEMLVNPQTIKSWREDRCWSQEHLAEAAGLSLRTIQRLENGESVSRETVLGLAAAFGVDASAFTRKAGEEAREAYLASARRRRAGAALAFWIHLATYIGVIGLLFGINYSSGRAENWVTWPAIGWGVGVFAHGAAVAISNWAAAREDQRITISSRDTCGVWEANGRSPLQMVYNLTFCVSPVYYR
ncbi:MAG: helix-turn-helix domain-containing protein [Okeania sp. SIO3C4]|nr:helix-turn-helix domain-containing protein [Okeania sp. SIO3C4]